MDPKTVHILRGESAGCFGVFDMLEGFGPGVGQAGANCETFWLVKSMFAQRHIMPMPLSWLNKAHFPIRPSREALTPNRNLGSL